MNIPQTKVKKLARMLLRENRCGRPWRTIAREDYKNKINQSTLSRIARGKGIWTPRDEKLLILLGVLKPRKPKPVPRVIPELEKRVRKQIAIMARQTRVDLGLRK